MSESKGDFATVIGPDAVIQGTLTFDKNLRLLGKFDGKIESSGTVHIAEGAELSGEVATGSIRIEGTMNGDLIATDKVDLAATARLEGDLRTARLEVADGAVFSGHVTVGPPVKKMQSNGAVSAPSSSSASTSSASSGNNGSNKSSSSSSNKGGKSGSDRETQPVGAGK